MHVHLHSLLDIDFETGNSIIESLLAYTFSWIYSSLASVTKPGHCGEGGERGTSIIHTILFRNTIATCVHMTVT